MAKKKMNAAERKEFEKTHDPLRLIHYLDIDNKYSFKISSRDKLEEDKKILIENGKRNLKHL